jgi:hypothetical protein
MEGLSISSIELSGYIRDRGWPKAKQWSIAIMSHQNQHPVALYCRLFSNFSEITVTIVVCMLQECWASDTGRMAWVASFTYRPPCHSAGGQHGPNASYGPWCLHTAFSPSEPIHWGSAKLWHGVAKSESPDIFCGLHSEGMGKKRHTSTLAAELTNIS